MVHPPGATHAQVMTVDVITPIVDDPWGFGAIAGANALSDVYAMGGQPQVALAFVGFPSDVLPLSALTEVFEGLTDACRRARCAIVGGHTVIDPEPKCGLSVVGTVDPKKVWSQRAARAGDALVLTKRIGTGIVAQAVKGGEATPEEATAARDQMIALNDVARDVGLAAGAHSCTDITGFGLLGHLKNLVEASGLRAVIGAADVPTLPGANEHARAGRIPGGSRRNLRFAEPITRFEDQVPEATRLLLADAQTSGGLLLCVPEGSADEAVRRLHAEGNEGAARIGEITEREGDGPSEIYVKA